MTTTKLPALFEHIQNQHREYAEFIMKPVVRISEYRDWQINLRMLRNAAHRHIADQRGD